MSNNTFVKYKKKNCQEHISSPLDPDGLTPHPYSVCWLRVGRDLQPIFWIEGQGKKNCDGKSLFVLVFGDLIIEL